jgi:transcriptional regulator GlxA family with amidase domain
MRTDYHVLNRRNIVRPFGPRRDYGSAMDIARAPAPRHIGLIGFDGVAALDLIGVLDAFTAADGSQWGAPRRRYITSVIGLSSLPFTAESGLRMLPDTSLDQAPPLDTIVVPGGPGLRHARTTVAVASWLRRRAGQTRRLVSVCTGLYGLAASGLLDGRCATTHWLHAADAARRFPQVTVKPDAIFIKDGPFYSSAGMTAGIDLALALIEEDHGPAVALATARQLVVYMKRSGGQLQYSEPLRFQTRAGDRFANLVAAILADLAADWTVEAMAARASLSPRQFTRRFRAAFAVSPAAYVEALRLDQARLHMAGCQEGLARIAHSVGFRSEDVFTRAFQHRFGLAPGAYRSRFASNLPHPQEPHHADPA